jgi:hypothetical protein
VSSILFLHALAKPARDVLAYEATWNYADTAELVGWYEVTYEDGFVQSVPLLYGVNILESSWGKSHTPSHLAYDAELVDCGESNEPRITFFSYEWINPRPGVRVKEVRLKAPAAKKSAMASTAPNTILLAGLSIVKKRTPPEPKPLRTTE